MNLFTYIINFFKPRVMKMNFYRCNVCGNVIVKCVDSGIPVSCCGEEMEHLEPHTMEQDYEKHLPVVSHIDANTVCVRVGSREHPMTESHYIQFIYLETEHGGQLMHLQPSDPPEAYFCVRHDRPLFAYAFCNIHGIWAAKCNK